MTEAPKRPRAIKTVVYGDTGSGETSCLVEYLDGGVLQTTDPIRIQEIAAAAVAQAQSGSASEELISLFRNRLNAFWLRLVFEPIPTAKAALEGFAAGFGAHDYCVIHTEINDPKRADVFDICAQFNAGEQFVYFTVRYAAK